MKLSSTFRLLAEEAKKIRYDMVNVNGGFSGGVEIKPGGVPQTMDISINIFGGSQSNAIAYQVPKKISDMQQAYIAAQQAGDPVSANIKTELETYYNNLRDAISLEVVALMKSFDAQAKESVNRAVANMNKKYGQ